MSVRDLVKHLAASLIVRGRIATQLGALRGRRVAVLAFHNVIGDHEPTAGDRSLHMRQQFFAELITVLHDRCGIISLDDALRRASDTKSLRFAITFDDAYAGAMTLGLDVLESIGVPSTVFVAPGLLGAAATWWDLAASSRSGAIPAATRDAWLDGPEGGRGVLIQPHLRSASALTAAFRISDAHLLGQAAARVGVTLASHSWSHPNLAALAEQDATNSELEAELRRPLEWLEATGVNTLPMLAYPYGRFSEKAARATADAGYTAAFRVDGGAISSQPSPAMAIPRINVPAAMRAGGVLWRVIGSRA